MNKMFALCVLCLTLILSSCATIGGTADVMYANVGLHNKADMMDVSKFDKQNTKYQKAGRYYLRGRDKILGALDKKYPGFREDILSGDPTAVKNAAGRLGEGDIKAAYWAGAGWLGAFSLDPMNMDLFSTIAGAPALLERGLELDPEFGHGAIHDVLQAWYASALPDMGGDIDRALWCYGESLRISGGKLPGPYVTYAQSICVPQQDAAGFQDALNKALATKPGEISGTRMAANINRKKARWLLDHRDNYFIDW
ncbi:MAG: TRAP transporter TatT component family protein [Spirochaetaceae bacterium]|jgi:predicted anti-sigma-YlaC factor YlaD|nr:TRAP transporter TatT component family protein [Spirochaetaceae bacterium]